MSNVYVIAEAGVNHNGELELARRLVDSAAEAGADAVKFQTFRAEDLVVPGAPTADYQKKQTGEDDQFTMLRKLELTREQHATIRDHCNAIGIEFFSTPFSVEAVDMLVALGVHRIKMPSGELTHRALVEHACASGLPVLLSTGMATLAEVQEALGWAQAVRASLDGLSVLHCTSAYPASDDALNLRAIATMRDVLKLPVGYSDHSLGIEASLAAVSLGATIIEKHLTLDTKLPGPDHAASLEPAAFGTFALLTSLFTYAARADFGLSQLADKQIPGRAGGEALKAGLDILNALWLVGFGLLAMLLPLVALFGENVLPKFDTTLAITGGIMAMIANGPVTLFRASSRLWEFTVVALVLQLGMTVPRLAGLLAGGITGSFAALAAY